MKILLDEILTDLGISRNYFSDISGVRPNTINDLCLGNSKRFEVETLEKIVYALNEFVSKMDIRKSYDVGDIIVLNGEDKRKVTPRHTDRSLNEMELSLLAQLKHQEDSFNRLIAEINHIPEGLPSNDIDKYQQYAERMKSAQAEMAKHISAMEYLNGQLKMLNLLRS
ncbi:helix-turn-helix transcriptional regulator [Paenibacillus pabuli]|uniref:helix-turn-helix domain-containing protein n=1 Tax=Paenibacillus pabuli TaxID=1472 RepID=UPI00324300C2